MSRLLPALLLAALAATAACFDRPTPACAFLCDEDGTCPDGYRCAPDQWCKRADVSPDLECGPSVAPDASPGDITADAGPDATPDDMDAAPEPDAFLVDAATPPDANPAALR